MSSVDIIDVVMLPLVVLRKIALPALYYAVTHRVLVIETMSSKTY